MTGTCIQIWPPGEKNTNFYFHSQGLSELQNSLMTISVPSSSGTVYSLQQQQIYPAGQQIFVTSSPHVAAAKQQQQQSSALKHQQQQHQPQIISLQQNQQGGNSYIITSIHSAADGAGIGGRENSHHDAPRQGAGGSVSQASSPQKAGQTTPQSATGRPMLRVVIPNTRGALASDEVFVKLICTIKISVCFTPPLVSGWVELNRCVLLLIVKGD